MPNDIKKIKFQYAILVYEDQDGKQKRFDFEEWLRFVNPIPHEQRVRKAYTNLVRFDKSGEKDERDGLIGMRFVRLRDSNMPYKVPSQKEAQDLDIADDEFIGESLHIVYDTDTRYFMIQVNRFSVGLNALAAYINQMSPNPDKIVRFIPFHKNLDRSKLRFGRYKTLELGLANVGAIDKSEFGFLSSIINETQNFDGHAVTIRISVGRLRKKSLNKSAVEDVIEAIPDLQGFVSSAKLKYCEGDFEKGEELNLLDLVENSVLSMQIEERKTLNFDYTINMMKHEYMYKRGTLKRMLNED